MIKTIAATDAKTLPADAVIIDVRTDAELEDCRLAAPYLHIPLDTICGDVLRHEYHLSEATPLYILCRAGVRAQRAAEQIAADGFTDVTVISGGIVSCVDCGHATEKGAL